MPKYVEYSDAVESDKPIPAEKRPFAKEEDMAEVETDNENSGSCNCGCTECINKSR